MSQAAYEEFYRLRARPFQLSPDPRFFFASTGHKRAMAYMIYGAHQGDGFIVVTGEIGAGKTILARKLAAELEAQSVIVAQLVSTQLGAEDLVTMIAGAFGLPPETSKAVQLQKLEQFLIECHKRGRRPLLIVDEAQNLPMRSVEELRMISNFTLGEKALLQIFILAQPEFRKMLRSRSLEQLRQRTIATCHLYALSRRETRGYVLHRLETVGFAGDPEITDAAFEAIHDFTAGIPRRINLFCDRLLLAGAMDEKHTLETAEVREVADELRAEFGAADGAELTP